MVSPSNGQQSAGVASCDRAESDALGVADQPRVPCDQFVVGLRGRHHPGRAAGKLARGYPSRRVTDAQLGNLQVSWRVVQIRLDRAEGLP